MISTVPGWAIFPLIFLLIGALLVVFIAWLIAISLLRPPRMEDGKAIYLLRRLSPSDVGLAYDPITFTVRDRAQSDGATTIDLAGWWMPHPDAAGRCAILLHGFADAKVGAIAWAPLFYEQRFNVLALDLRAHGQSGGTHSTGGYFERFDVEQVIDQLAISHPNDARQIVLFGASLGANVALATAELFETRGGAAADARSPAKPPSDARSPILGLVLDCPFAHFRSAVAAHGRLLGAPSTFVNPLSLQIAQHLSGARLDEFDPLHQMRSLTTPMMIVSAGRDVFVGPADRAAIEAAVTARAAFDQRSIFWRDEDAPHLLNLATDPATYRSHLKQFCDRLP